MQDQIRTVHPFDPEAQTGKIAVVTGASSGIGRASVEQLTATGWQVFALARRQERLQSLAQETGARALTLDVTDPEAVSQVAQQILEETGGQLDALVNVAGGARGIDPVARAKNQDWEWMFQVNVLGTLNMVRAFLPALRKNGCGSILNVTSTAAEAGYEGGSGYNAAKFGQRALTEVLRLEEAEHRVRVIEVCPGMVYTPEFSLKRLGSAEAAAQVYAGVEQPLRAEDVAQTITFALNVPHHVNLDRIVMRPLAQAAQYKVIRKTQE